jgi:translation initiation factor 5A
MMGEDGASKDDVKVPEGELGQKIEAIFEAAEKEIYVIVQSAMGEEAAIDYKEMKGSS